MGGEGYPMPLWFALLNVGCGLLWEAEDWLINPLQAPAGCFSSFIS